MNRNQRATTGLFVAWIVNDLEELATSSDNSRTLVTRLPDSIPVPASVRQRGLTARYVATGVPAVGLVLAAASVGGYRTPGRMSASWTPRAEVGALIDDLANDGDCPWPSDRWPAMRFDHPLGFGASGGHCSIRYAVGECEQGRRVRFRFDPRLGLAGQHEFEAATDAGPTTLRHTLEVTPRAGMRVAWPLIFRWLHDALIEDALDRAETATTGTPVKGHGWPLWVRLLRTALRGKRPSAERLQDC
jgi:hypothetical protein